MTDEEYLTGALTKFRNDLLETVIEGLVERALGMMRGTLPLVPGPRALMDFAHACSLTLKEPLSEDDPLAPGSHG